MGPSISEDPFTMKFISSGLSHDCLRPWGKILGLAWLLCMGCRPQEAEVSAGAEKIPSASHPEIRPHYALLQIDDCQGVCDGSGGVAIDEKHFVIVNDETSELLIYERSRSGLPKQRLNIRKHLDLKKKEEADLEAMARVGNTFYVIGSHSRDNEGKKQKERRAFMGFSLEPEAGLFRLQVEGKPYDDLMSDLLKDPSMAHLSLESAYRQAGDDPKGLNIEALCAGANNSLWIGFRGPLIDGKALMVQLSNPQKVCFGTQARFGGYALLDLGGQSIRGADSLGEDILIIADDPWKQKGANLFFWDGKTSTPEPIPMDGLALLDPEAVFIFPDTQWQILQVLSDDGGRRRGEKDCGNLDTPSAMGFRSASFAY